MPLSETAATAVTERFQARLADIANRASTVSLRAWEQLGAWDRVDIDRFTAATTDAFNAAQAAAVNTSSGYYALLADRPVTVPAVTTTAVVEAPFTAYWHALAEGADWAEALATGGTRAESIASDLIVGTSREVANLTAGTGVAGWRRVLTDGSCKFCSTVAGQRYRSKESATFGHDDCDCIVVPIYADTDPGQVINARHLARVADGVPGIRV